MTDEQGNTYTTKDILITPSSGVSLADLDNLMDGREEIKRTYTISFLPGITMTPEETFADQRKFIEDMMYSSGLDYIEGKPLIFVPFQGGMEIVISCKKSKLGGARYNYDIKKKGEFERQDSKGMKITTRKVHKAKDELVESLKSNDNK